MQGTHKRNWSGTLLHGILAFRQITYIVMSSIQLKDILSIAAVDWTFLAYCSVAGVVATGNLELCDLGNIKGRSLLLKGLTLQGDCCPLLLHHVGSVSLGIHDRTYHLLQECNGGYMDSRGLACNGGAPGCSRAGCSGDWKGFKGRRGTQEGCAPLLSLSRLLII